MGNNYWTPEEDRLLKRLRFKLDNQALADRFNRTRKSVSNRISDKGLARVARWSEKNDEYLSDNSGVKPDAEICKYLNRTPDAIAQRRYHLRVSVYENSYTANTLARELGVGRGRLMNWYRKGMIDGEQSKTNAIYKAMIFVEESIVMFLKKYYDMLDYRKIINLYFKNIVKYLQRGEVLNETN